MRVLFAALALAFVLILSACGGGDGEGAADGGDGGFDGEVLLPDSDRPITAEPGTDRSQWAPGSDRTRQVTGRLTTSMPEGRSGLLVLAFGNGLTYRLSQLAFVTGKDETRPGGKSFAELLGADPDAEVFVYKVASEEIDRVAPEGGLCARERATFVAMAEFQTNEGNWTLRAAAFKGEGQPGPNAPSDPVFCQAFIFRPL